MNSYVMRDDDNRMGLYASEWVTNTRRGAILYHVISKRHGVI